VKVGQDKKKTKKE